MIPSFLENVQSRPVNIYQGQNSHQLFIHTDNGLIYPSLFPTKLPPHEVYREQMVICLDSEGPPISIHHQTIQNIPKVGPNKLHPVLQKAPFRSLAPYCSIIRILYHLLICTSTNILLQTTPAISMA